MAIVCNFAGSVQDYQAGKGFAVWLIAVRPQRCPHCGGTHCTILWGCYLRWVYTITDRFQVRIVRVRCTACGVTDALLPRFLHMFRRYILPLIQRAITLALEGGVWGHRKSPTQQCLGDRYQPVSLSEIGVLQCFQGLQ